VIPELKNNIFPSLVLIILLLLLGVCKQAFALVDYDSSYSNLIDRYILARLTRLGIEPHWASQQELMRRMSLDITGKIPSTLDTQNLTAATPNEMAIYFMNKPEFASISQLGWADILLFSNDQMFSTDVQIDNLNQLVASLHNGAIMYDVFVQQVLMDRAFLSRFVSSADRNTAAFNIFLGYETVTPYDFEFSKMFNGYTLTNSTLREYTWTGNCDNSATTTVETCIANIWGMTGQTPTDAGVMLVSLPAFAEHGADIIWHRYIGSSINIIIPQLSIALGEQYANSGFDLRAMTLLILTSAAYTQSYSYRDKDLVL